MTFSELGTSILSLYLSLHLHLHWNTIIVHGACSPKQDMARGTGKTHPLLLDGESERKVESGATEMDSARGNNRKSEIGKACR